MKYKVIIIIILSLKLISCNNYDVKNYPQNVSYIDGFPNVVCKYELEINNYNEIPKKIQNLTEQYIIKNVGSILFKKCKFNYGLLSSDKKIIIKRPYQSKLNNLLADISQRNEYFIDSIYHNGKLKYPIYSISFQFNLPKKGIALYDINLIIDSEGNIIKEIDFPKVNINTFDFVGLDSIHKILVEKKISNDKLELNLRFDNTQKKLYYYASTLIKGGSILGPSCMPSYKYHFKIDAISGELIEYNIKDNMDYFLN